MSDYRMALALTAGALVGLGVVVLVLAIIGLPRRDVTPRRVRSRKDVERQTKFAVGGVIVFAATLVVTQWLVLAAVFGLVVAFWDRLFGGARVERRAIEQIEGLATWTESLRDTIAGAVGLEQAIPATAVNAAPSIRPSLNLLVDRLRVREPLPEALMKFADDLDDPSADLVVASLILNARLRGPGLRSVLTALSQSARDELDLRRRVEGSRRSTRRSVLIVVLVIGAMSGFLILFNPGYVEPYDSPQGQVVLAVVLGLYALSIMWLRRLAGVRQPERFLVQSRHQVTAEEAGAMILQMAVGAVIGLGFLLLIWVLAKPAPGVGATLARLDAGRRSQRAATTTAAGSRLEARIDALRDGIGGRIEAEAMARGLNLDATRTNLAVMNKSMASHLGLKVLLAIGALIWFPLVLSAVGISVVGLPAIGVIAAVVFFFMLPDLTLRREADARRADFRHVMGSFLDLVAMNLAGGRGLPEALMAASSIGDHWAMVRIRQALSNARIMGMTPWEGIADLGTELGVDELRDLASALALAGDEGAKIRTSLMARSDSMRRKELVNVEGAAGENSQTMLLAQLLMCTAFLIFLAYPAVQQLGGT